MDEYEEGGEGAACSTYLEESRTLCPGAPGNKRGVQRENGI